MTEAFERATWPGTLGAAAEIVRKVYATEMAGDENMSKAVAQVVALLEVTALKLRLEG